MQSLSNSVIDTNVGCGVPHLVAPRPNNRPSTTSVRRVRESRLKLLEAITNLAGCDGVDDACRSLADDLQQVMSVQKVAIGLVGRKTRIQLRAISDTTTFDPHGEFVRAVEAVMNSDINAESDENDPIRKQLLRVAAASRLQVIPLDRPTSNDDDPSQSERIGVLVLLGGSESDSTAKQNTEELAAVMASSLALVRDAQPGRIKKLMTRVGKRSGKWETRATWFGILAATFLMLCPWPYQIGCPCELQPEIRRFVAAPFAGRLDHVAVHPGDLVAKGTVLARCDQREVQLKLDSLQAERRQAKKQQDAALAAGKVATAQLSQLDVRRLSTEIRLLQNRLKHLEIQSPIEGVVVSGDLERAVGAPVETGQTLFEIAPLGTMVVNLELPEADILQAEPGQWVNVRLEGIPQRKWQAQLLRIRPRAEVRNGANIFIAELELQNDDHRLRPGMKGRATIAGPNRPLAWNWFHKAWNSAAMYMGW